MPSVGNCGSQSEERCNHEGVWWSGGIAPPFLTSALDAPAVPRARDPSGRSLGGPKSRFRCCGEVKKKNLQCLESNPTG
jgi:hypothetical protein